MRRDYQADSGKAKALARKKYAERQIKKWVDWSWNMRGRVIYKQLIEQIEKYERK
jgi:bisphosphoglycerate-dependent phosphoglycerate mutase